VNDPIARILQLLSLLQTHKFWPGSELAQRLEVSARTLRRDVERLRDLGYPVDAAPGVAGGYRLAAGAHMPPLLLDDDEAVAIAVGLRAAATASVEGMEETSVRALAKLEQVLPDHLRRRVEAVHSSVMPLTWGGTDDSTVDAGALAVLAQGCRDREQVRFEYRRRDGDEARRLVEPHQLVSAGRRWYLVAWDVRRADWRTFRLDRLSQPALAGARFPARTLPAPDAAEFVARSLSAMPMPHRARVVDHGPLEEVRQSVRWLDADVSAVDERTSRVELRSETPEWLLAGVAILAVAFDIELDAEASEPSDVAGRIAALGARLGGAAAHVGMAG